MEGYAAEVGGVLQKKLMPLDEALREEMLETRVAVNDQAANIEKVSQVRSWNSLFMEHFTLAGSGQDTFFLLD